jgi:hypothetical protein
MQAKYSLAAGAVAVATALTAGLITVSARATDGLGIPSAGEASPFLVCFYECKRNFDVNVRDDDDDDDDDGNGGRPGDGYWKEVTLLVLANQRNESIGGHLYVLDGNQFNQSLEETVVYEQAFNLSEQDLEEINICRRADRELRPRRVPEAGTILVELDKVDGQQVYATGVYGWVKNVLGEINRFVEDPFNSHVRDVAKTECRLVPAPPG